MCVAPRESPGNGGRDPPRRFPQAMTPGSETNDQGFSVYSFCKLMSLIISLDAEATVWILASSSACNVLHMLFNLESIISLLLH